MKTFIVFCAKSSTFITKNVLTIPSRKRTLFAHTQKKLKNNIQELILHFTIFELDF